MPSVNAFDRRLPLYAYLEPLFVGRRILEIGCGTGAGAEYLSRVAAHVLSIDADGAVVERARARHRRANLELRAVSGLADIDPGDRFDVVLVPEAEAAAASGALPVQAWKRALVEDGRLVVAASSADRPGRAAWASLGYYEISDALFAHFPRVQMFGLTPFAGLGVVEFEAGADALRVDSRLVEEGAEPPSAYLAVAGSEPAEGLGYALVQVPFAPIEARLGVRAEADDHRAEGRLAASERRLEDVERRARGRLEEAEGRIAELRRKLDDASVQSDSAIRVARAQGEEIEELRGRLRRAAEDRGAQDAELGRLRRALAEADESVMTLTRRTAEEMSAVAQRLAVGLRAPAEPEARERPADYSLAREEAERLSVALAETEARASAAEQHLEEVATDARERQATLDDAFERLRLAEDAIARERREAARLQQELRAAAVAARSAEEVEDALSARDERIARLEGEKQDLAWRLAELEEKLRAAIARAIVSDGRGHPDELVATRAARDRALAEFHRAAGAHIEEVTQLRASVAEQAALVSELEDAVVAAEARAASGTAEAASLRRNAKALEDADRTRRTRLAELEGKLLRLEHERRAAAAAPQAPAAGDREAETRRLGDLARERDALRAELTGARVRIGELEGEVAALGVRATARPTPPPAPASNGHGPAAAAVVRELDTIEAGLREELAVLAEIERALGAEPPRPAEPAPGEASLLEATLQSYRRRAGRLCDEFEGIRRRWESLSPAEISGYLEELGEDLAELEK